MESDSIVYIIIAIVIAVVNGVLQKKKKDAAKSPVLPSQQPNTINSETAGQPYASANEEQISPFEILFGKNEPIESDIDLAMTHAEISKPEAKTAFEAKLADSINKRTHKRTEEFADFNNQTPIFDFNEDSIESTAIGNVLTEEEEEQAAWDNKSDLLKDFDARKAILYSEIIKPKYFSAGVNR